MSKILQIIPAGGWFAIILPEQGAKTRPWEPLIAWGLVEDGFGDRAIHGFVAGNTGALVDCTEDPNFDSYAKHPR